MASIFNYGVNRINGIGVEKFWMMKWFWSVG